MIAVAVGLGARSTVTADALVVLVRLALSRVDARPLGLWTLEGRERLPAIAFAAAVLGLPLRALPATRLAAEAAGAVTRSSVVLDRIGLPSVAETAALAGAGTGARLLLPRLAAMGATVALAAPESLS